MKSMRDYTYTARFIHIQNVIGIARTVIGSKLIPRWDTMKIYKFSLFGEKIEMFRDRFKKKKNNNNFSLTPEFFVVIQLFENSFIINKRFQYIYVCTTKMYYLTVEITFLLIISGQWMFLRFDSMKKEDTKFMIYD